MTMADRETQMLKRLQRGSTAALDEIMESYEKYVAAVIINQLGKFATKEDTEELMSNVFYSLWTHRSELRTDNLRGWLAAVARNEARAFLRKHRPETVDIEDYIFIEDGDDPVSEIEMASVLQKTLDVLDSKSKEIFVRHFYYGQTVAMISKEMALNPSNIKSSLQRGKEKLRRAMLEGGYDYES